MHKTVQNLTLKPRKAEAAPQRAAPPASDDSVAILGYRKDRLGGRLTTLVNTLRFARTFGCSARYWWLADTEGEDKTLVDPTWIFDPDFVAEHMIVAPEAPDLSSRDDIAVHEGRSGIARFREHLGKGVRIHMDSLGITRLIDEDPDEVRATLRDVVRDLRFHPRIQSRLDSARATLAGLDGQKIAMHVRRGDLLWREPWCKAKWTAKFVPDEFFLALVEDGPVIGFTDTPDALDRLRRKARGITPVREIVDLDGCTEVERDVLELLLMAECDVIAAPTLSAFSTTAAVIGGKSAKVLPRDLSPAQRDAGYEALLARVVEGPDAFFAPGDYAQSVAYAYRHALRTGQGHRLHTALARQDGVLDSFPYLLPMAASLALQRQAAPLAKDYCARTLAAPGVWKNDTELAEGLEIVANHILEGDTDTILRRFLSTLFARRGPDEMKDAAVYHFIATSPAVRDFLMLDDTVLARLAQPYVEGAPAVPAPPELAVGADVSAVLPLWVIGVDWQHLFTAPSFHKTLRKTPTFGGKRRSFPPGLRDRAEAFLDNDSPLPDRPGDTALLGLYASVLTTHEKLRRARKLLSALEERAPDDPMIRLRRGNALLAAGQPRLAADAFRAATERRPGHAGLLYLAGKALEDIGQKDEAAAFHARASNQRLSFPQAHEAFLDLLRQVDRKHIRRTAIDRAVSFFPAHGRFRRMQENQAPRP